MEILRVETNGDQELTFIRNTDAKPEDLFAAVCAVVDAFAQIVEERPGHICKMITYALEIKGIERAPETPVQ